MPEEQNKFEGKVKEVGGKLTGDDELESEGKTQHSAGKAEGVMNDAKDKAKGVGNAIKDALPGGDKKS